MFQKALTKFWRRPFPRNLRALRSCRISYAQFGEDLFITTLLGYEKSHGIYVDAGCYHPIDYSNTYIFYQRGWHGIAIDPNPVYASEWQRYRPRDHFVLSAVSSSVGSMTYSMNKRYPAHNRLLTERSRTPSPDEIQIDVPTRPLRQIVEEFLPEGPIDLLNVDCEEHDLEVLKTYDFSRNRPHVIAAEDLAAGRESPICAFLESHRYSYKAQIGFTKIFQAET